MLYDTDSHTYASYLKPWMDYEHKWNLKYGNVENPTRLRVRKDNPQNYDL